MLPLLVATLALAGFAFTPEPAAEHGLPLDLARQTRLSFEHATRAILVKVEGDEAFTVDCSTVPIEHLAALVAQKQAADPGRPVLLYLDPGASYQRLVELYDALGPAADAPESPPGPLVLLPTSSELGRASRWFGHNPFEARCAAPRPGAPEGRTGQLSR